MVITYNIRLVKKIINQVEDEFSIDVKNLILMDNTFEIIDKVINVIPYVKAELEFEFWYKLYTQLTIQSML